MMLTLNVLEQSIMRDWSIVVDAKHYDKLDSHEVIATEISDPRIKYLNKEVETLQIFGNGAKPKNLTTEFSISLLDRVTHTPFKMSASHIDTLLSAATSFISRNRAGLKFNS